MLATYAAVGFLLVPALIRHQLSSFAQTTLARQASAGEVRFNPFTLRLEAHDVRLDEADGRPLFSVAKLIVEPQWRSLVRRAWSFAEIRITAPNANLVVTPDGRFNLADLLATFERRPHDTSTSSRLPRVVIDRFAVEQGKVSLQDRRAGYANLFSPIDVTMSSFSTLPDQKDSYTFSAQSARGGKLRWTGHASVDPIRASGKVTLENVALPELAAYLKSYTRATLAAGRLSATLPYELAYDAGKLQARLVGASLSLRELALAREGATDSFAGLTRMDVNAIDADLVRREATVGELRADGGKLSVRRDAKGELDLASLMAAAAGPQATMPGSTVAPGITPVVVVDKWKLAVRQIIFDQVSVNALDETVNPPLQAVAGKVRLQMALDAEQTGAELQLKLSGGALTVSDLALDRGTQTFKLARLGFTDGALDLAARRASVGRLEAGGGQMQLTRDREGRFNVISLLPRFDAAVAPAPAPLASASSASRPWLASAKTLSLDKFNAQVVDQGSGIKVHVDDLALQFEGASSDLRQSVPFTGSLNLREGGQLSAQGSVVPASGELQADVRASQLALAPLQPLLAQYLKLKIAAGKLSGQGRLSAGSGTAKSPALRYNGGLAIAGLALNEVDGTPFASWNSVAAEKFSAGFSPFLLEIPELRVAQVNAKLIIENDRSFNAARLLVRPSAPGAGAQAAPAIAATDAQDPFPVRIGRLRLQDAKLDFVDLSLRPEFGAKIYELNGVVSGLSSSAASRSRVELDGRVDEFGLVRIRGDLNPLAAANNTDVGVVFKNIDMVSASPYTMKFAGYRIAEGKMSLDLQYKVRDGQLEGANQIVIDKLRLGERVDSPDAFKLPLELAIAILKDSDGRIDLGLPVSGNVNDPQFSYGAVIAKAMGNVLAGIISAPFRALGRLLGIKGGGEKLEAIGFDPGSHRLLPPEREKLTQVAQIMAKREQLRLSVPAQYSETADGIALKVNAVRAEIARVAGIKLQPGEVPGPVDVGDDAVRRVLRGMAASRFNEGGSDKDKQAAVAEPQGAEATAFYARLLERLEQSQPLAADELAGLGTQRSAAIVAALGESGVDASRVVVTAAEKVNAEPGKSVPLKLGLINK